MNFFKIYNFVLGEKGFTLVELLAVVVILGILISISVPKVIQVVDNAQGEADLADLNALRSAVEIYSLQNRKLEQIGEGKWVDDFFEKYINTQLEDADRIVKNTLELEDFSEAYKTATSWQDVINNLTPKMEDEMSKNLYIGLT
ncbi:type II secretion system protein [Natranaerobius trueperi]|uniref:Prepilin-type cleavage/methylation domain-containing protein n=1 Tax=Natranaerobius trueperi TaxID=759412 RepID=A0A226BYP5_9FIRM|nr:prepilin-type N-terminal cleavage/methylation domain-containing protein [Natranaerobius trueperi]OWZ84051.1 hypothetical protein CDO51_05690 [Natranaerobius trueperi]